MITVNDIEELQRHLAAERAAGASICLVPTMGNLHAGHLALVDRAKEACDKVIASIFVNPMQFGPQEDFAEYPRTMEKDLAMLEQRGCDFVFTPAVSAIYGDSGDSGKGNDAGGDNAGGDNAESIPLRRTAVRVPRLGDEFCGESRPGHFTGVTTVVNILFNLVRPDAACFGLKDYQQFLLVRQMVQDLHLGIDIIGVETQREPSGLAMSSRNNYLSPAQRQQAAVIYRCLQDCKSAILKGERNYPTLEKTAKSALSEAGLKPDYFAIREANSLQPPTPTDSHLAILAAAYLANTHLIDNLRLHLPT